MLVIVGLGNPGKEYQLTRHNTGFMAIDKIAEAYNIKVETRKFDALIGDGIINGMRVMLVKPQTFMNLSGNSVRKIFDFYHLSVKDILVIFDDISLEVGNIRIKQKGSAGGHNGIKSIIANLNSQEFSRIKIGVGDKKEGSDLADHVLSQFSKSEQKILEDKLLDARDAVADIIQNGIGYAMNKYN